MKQWRISLKELWVGAQKFRVILLFRESEAKHRSGSFPKFLFPFAQHFDGWNWKRKSYSIYVHTLNPSRHFHSFFKGNDFHKAFFPLIVCERNLSLVSFLSFCFYVHKKVLNLGIHITFLVSERRPFTITPGRRRRESNKYPWNWCECGCAVKIGERSYWRFFCASFIDFLMVNKNFFYASGLILVTHFFYTRC